MPASSLAAASAQRPSLMHPRALLQADMAILEMGPAPEPEGEPAPEEELGMAAGSDTQRLAVVTIPIPVEKEINETKVQEEKEKLAGYKGREFPTIEATLSGIPELSTLYAALEASGLKEMFMNSEANYTMFAPTNEVSNARCTAMGCIRQRC